jgi:outer membrane biosynthesis protein TonB
VHFCTRDPNLNPTRAEPGLGAGFIFAPETQKKPGTQKKPKKKPKTRKKPKKTQKNLKPEKPPKETRKNTERNPITKPNRHPTDSGSGAKFHLRVRVQVSNST